MPSFLKSVAVPALALAGSSLANPFKRGDDACLAAVTGKAALGDDNIRKDHCSSFIKTIVTPAAITVTTTITDAPEPTAWENYKRDVTVCPNEVPNYASACDEAGYKSACKVFGISGETTFTIPATTTTKTVYKNGGSTCDGAIATSYVTKTVTEDKGSATVTSTVTKGNGNGNGNGYGSATETVTVTEEKGSATVTSTVTEGKGSATVTVTATGGFAGPSGKCISKDKADYFVNSFIDLLEYTNYPGDAKTHAPAGRGYHQNVSDAVLDVNFADYSDSINWMAGIPLGSVTFPNKAAFDYGQGQSQPEVAVETLNTWYGCNTIAWRWKLTPFTGAEVRGINNFIISDDGEKIIANYAEFDNAAWLSSFGLACKVPTASTSTNTTTSP